MYLCGPLHEYAADVIIALLLTLGGEPGGRIGMAANSPGGSVTGILDAYSTVGSLSSVASTRRVELAAFEGAFP